MTIGYNPRRAPRPSAREGELVPAEVARVPRHDQVGLGRAPCEGRVARRHASRRQQRALKLCNPVRGGDALEVARQPRGRAVARGAGRQIGQRGGVQRGRRAVGAE